MHVANATVLHRYNAGTDTNVKTEMVCAANKVLDRNTQKQREMYMTRYNVFGM